jgi:carbamoyltransferase
MKKLYVNRSKFQCVTHLDYSARIQTVNKQSNPKYWKLLKAVKKQIGHGMLVNTSFNVRGEPIVCSPFDAYRCFMNTEMDYLVIENFVYCKTEQINWQNKKEWTIKYKED